MVEYEAPIVAVGSVEVEIAGGVPEFTTMVTAWLPWSFKESVTATVKP
jgi:hypothetical protein